MLRVGDRIGEWVVERSLGEGGMGAVYRVHSALSARVVAALKVMKPTTEPDARARFVREAEALSALRHPAIVHVMGFSEDPVRGLPYLVMELAVGETLRERLEKGPLPLAEVITTFAVLAAALDHAHEAGVYHRDIKPANVILVPDGTVRLVDFGIAAAPATDSLENTSGHLGTLSYLPPEVFRGQPAEPSKMDVYAFGLLLYESLTGQRAFPVEPRLPTAAAAAKVGMRKLQQDALDPGEAVPDRLRDIIRSATSPDPAGRPPIDEVRQTLDALRDRRVSSGPVAAMPWMETAMRESRPPQFPLEEHTTRVPDPTGEMPPPGRLTGPRRSYTVAWIALAVLLGAGVIAALATRDGAASRPKEAEVPGEAPRGVAARPAPPATLPSFRPPSPVPSPSPIASPSASPRTPPSIPPSSPSTAPRPEVAAAVPEPEADPPPADEPAEEGAAPPDEGAERVPQLGGRWELTNQVESTSHAPYQGLRIGYRLRLQQDGTRLSGVGQKVSENGVVIPPSQRTPIEVSGTIEGSQVVLRFTEHGAERNSGGVFRWRVSPDGATLEGRFSSDAAASRGSSAASRIN